MRRLAVSSLAALMLGACGTPHDGGLMPGLQTLPTYQRATASQQALFDLPPPSRPISVAVYGFTDQTGQFRASSTGQTLSRAVTQGGSSVLMKALQDAGSRDWFTIVEREQASHLLSERQIIREMRERYLGETQINAEALPAWSACSTIRSRNTRKSWCCPPTCAPTPKGCMTTTANS